MVESYIDGEGGGIVMRPQRGLLIWSVPDHEVQDSSSLGNRRKEVSGKWLGVTNDRQTLDLDSAFLPEVHPKETHPIYIF